MQISKIQKWINNYTGYFRKVRLFYIIYNYINKNKLQHNKQLYQRFKINQSIYRSVSSKLFENKIAKTPWLDNLNKNKEIINHPRFAYFQKNIQEGILSWYENGYIIVENYIEEKQIDEVNQDVEYLLQTEVIQFNYTKRKIFNAHLYAPSINHLVYNKKIISILSFILDKEVMPFQTINFIKGSEQAPHSDWIHMSTFPKGYLIGVWIALEDVQLDAGPIAYYPTSHKLPYLDNEQIGSVNNFFLLDENANAKYEKKIAQQIQDNDLKAQPFVAKKGDMLIWHANLIHEGMPILDKNLTRKSMVIHYFAKDVICYHEISERPALLEEKKLP